MRNPPGARTRSTISPRTPPIGSRRSGYDYRGTTVHEIPPNGQGIAALMALGILENFDLAAMPPDSARDAAPRKSRR